MAVKADFCAFVWNRRPQWRMAAVPHFGNILVKPLPGLNAAAHCDLPFCQKSGFPYGYKR